MTDAEVLTVGLLAEQDRYGYQIEEEIHKRNMRSWANIGFSSIYYILSSLEKRTLLTSRQEKSPKGPSRRIYSLTALGWQQLTREALQRLKDRIPLPTSFYVGLALLKHLDQSAVLSALKAHRREVSKRLRRIRRRRRADVPLITQEMLELGNALAEAEAKWLETYIKEGVSKRKVRLRGNTRWPNGR